MLNLDQQAFLHRKTFEFQSRMKEAIEICNEMSYKYPQDSKLYTEAKKMFSFYHESLLQKLNTINCEGVDYAELKENLSRKLSCFSDDAKRTNLQTVEKLFINIIVPVEDIMKFIKDIKEIKFF